MNQRQLSYFITVMDSGSIKSAAELLMISPQGLSKTIIGLEKELGNKLFIRTREGLKPTTYAKKLKPYALGVIKAYEDLSNNMGYSTSQKEIFNVVTTYDFICLLNTDLIQRFYEENPNVQLNLVEMTDYPAIDKLAKNEVEIAILPAPLDTTMFKGERIFTAKHCLIINNKNSLCNKKSIQYADLNGQPLALKGREYVMYNSNINRFLSAGADPTIYIETSSDTLIADLAEQNIAIGISLDYIAKADPRPGTTIKMFADEACSRTLYIAQPINAVLSKTALSFKNIVKQYFLQIIC